MHVLNNKPVQAECRRNNVKMIINIAAVLGVTLWIGALSPEIFVNSGDGCIFDEKGEALTDEEAEAFMKSYFYQKDDDGENKVKIKYKFAITELF